MAFDSGFTGKNILSPIAGDTSRASERMSDLILGAERLKLETFRQNQDDFLKATNIDPVFVLASSARDTQSKMLNEFNTKWGEIMRQRNGNLTTEDKMQLAKEKDFILMNQQKMQSDMTQALAAKDAIQKDYLGRLDHDDFDTRFQNFMQTGTWDNSPLLPAKVSPVQFYGSPNNKFRGNDTEITLKRNEGGNTITETATSSGTEEQGREKVKADFFSHDGLARAYTEEFAQLKETNPQEYKDYISQPNGIMKWAQDKHWQDALDIKNKKVTAPQTQRSGGGGGYMRTWGGSKYTPTSAIDDGMFKKMHAFQDLNKAVRLPVRGMELMESGVVKPSDAANATVTGYVIGYDEDTDKVKFLVSRDFKDLDYSALASGAGMQVALKRSDFAPETFADLEIVKDGKYVKIGNLPIKKAEAPVKKKAY